MKSESATERAPVYPSSQIAVPENPLKLGIETHCYSGAVVIHCEGRAMFRSQARSLANIIMEVLPATGCMIVDLAGVGTVDGEALGELVMTHMWAEAAGHTLKFACPTLAVRNLLDATNLVSVFDVYGSVPDAMAGMHQEQILSC